MMTSPSALQAGVRTAARCVLLATVAVVAGCGAVAGATHELTFELTGSGPAARAVTIDPPGEQVANAVSEQQVSLPWSRNVGTGYGFARFTATADGPLTCRILVNGNVIATATSRPGLPVECRANLQDQ